jgi:hypothetical protein
MTKPKPRLTLRRHNADGSYALPPSVDDGGVGDGVPRYALGNGQLHWPQPKGNRLGRKKGVPNAIGTMMKVVLLEAAAQSKRGRGSLLTYLSSLADDFPQCYARLLGRLIPHDLRLKLRAELDEPLESVEDVKRKLAARGIDVSRLSLFDKPEVPQRPAALRPVQRRPDPPPRDDEDALDREPQPAVLSEPEPPRIYANPYDPDPRHRPPPTPYVCGETPIGTQYELPWGGGGPGIHHCWHWGRPPRLIVSNNEESTDEPPPQQAAE